MKARLKTQEQKQLQACWDWSAGPTPRFPGPEQRPGLNPLTSQQPALMSATQAHKHVSQLLWVSGLSVVSLTSHANGYARGWLRAWNTAMSVFMPFVFSHASSQHLQVELVPLTLDPSPLHLADLCPHVLSWLKFITFSSMAFHF